MRKLRLFAPLIAAFVALLHPDAARSATPTTIHLRADHIDFYYDKYLIEADGNVRVTSSDGTTITGDTFSMDLKMNRMLIASNVHLRSPGGSVDGAAIADFLDNDRVYFIPVIAKPDRWTYANGNYKEPLKGDVMPGDVFYFPDLGKTPVFLTAHSATIGAKTYVRFSGVVSYGLNVPIPVPAQYIYFGQSRDLAQNSLAGANMDLTFNAYGDANSISAVHLRSDRENGFYTSYEQHVAWQNGYSVFSVNPGTKLQKFWSLINEERLGKRFQIDSYTQVFTRQHFLEEPTAAGQWTYLTATQAFNQSFVRAFATFVNYNLLNPPRYTGSQNHPFALNLGATTFNHRIGKTPFYENLSYGMGYNVDNYQGLQTHGGVLYNQIWNHSLGGTLYLPGLKVGNRDNPYKSYQFNATFSKNYTWFSVPHHTVATNTTLSLARQFVRQFNMYAQYNITNTGDYYHDGHGYGPQPGETPTPCDPSAPVCSLQSFRGVVTQHTTTLGATYSANPNFVATLTYLHHQDYPKAYPGLFAEPPLNNLGDPQYSNYLGQPPNHIVGEVRALVLPHVVVDVQRGYFFNFGDDRWSPQFSIQVVGQ